VLSLLAFTVRTTLTLIRILPVVRTAVRDRCPLPIHRITAFRRCRATPHLREGVTLDPAAGTHLRLRGGIYCARKEERCAKREGEERKTRQRRKERKARTA